MPALRSKLMRSTHYQALVEVVSCLQKHAP